MAFSSDLQNSFGNSSSSFRPSIGSSMVPHRGSLCRIEGADDTQYILEVVLEDGTTHELQFQRKDFDFCMRLFAIMDTDSKGKVPKIAVREFVTLRCPVFWRRDDDLRSMGEPGFSPTFEEVWRAVASSSIYPVVESVQDFDCIELGVEAWMVFCRFIALAQYLEAKRRFSGRHLQQTMRHRNAPRGSEVVVVDVPPPAPPVPLSASQLAQYERESHKCLPLPELDLDHSLLAAHDVLRRRKDARLERGCVKIDLFGSAHSLMSPGASNAAMVEFCLTYVRHFQDGRVSDTISVRRSMKDMKWINDTFMSQKSLGGTLCGRILPPFPGKISSSQYHGEDSTLGSTGDAIAAAATAGVGMLTKGIKSLWGSYMTTSPKPHPGQPTEKTPPTNTSIPSKTATVNCALPESYYNPNSPACKARQLERYVNYLLEHPALSTSFALNTILKASQSGLEAAKHSLEDHMKASKEIKEQAPKLDDGKLTNFWPLHGSNSPHPNLSWVRTAAQAAVALQLHGVLETTGMPSASARLQHASLPSFGHSRNTAWNDEEGDGAQTHEAPDESFEDAMQESFEEGVLHVSDELESDGLMFDDNVGYDLLPLPVPAPERRILALSGKQLIGWNDDRETRFRYGGSSLMGTGGDPDEGQQAYLGDIAVDENIDKLRDIIGSVDNTLSRCMASSGGIGRARKERSALHLDIVRGLDMWEGLRGKFVSQRALLKGVSGLEQSREVFEESDLAIIDDISWQTALASSAVSAAEDVRSTVRAARTAANAKTAAGSAAIAAQNTCDKGKFNSLDEARAAQTRASIAHSHAIHAAVVEYEAKTAKRRAALALAHDVKCWNTHRKREILQTALAYAKSQHEATRRAVDAWSCLRDGYVGPAIIPSTQSRRVKKKPSRDMFRDDATATIYDSGDNRGNLTTIVAVEHELLRQSDNITPFEADEIADAEPEVTLPLVLNSPIPEEDEEENDDDDDDLGHSDDDDDDDEEGGNFGIFDNIGGDVEADEADHDDAAGIDNNDDDDDDDDDNDGAEEEGPEDFLGGQLFERGLGQDLEKGLGKVDFSNAPPIANPLVPDMPFNPVSSGFLSTNSTPQLQMKHTTADGEENEALTSSMQSLVDGLMNWGGQYDDEDFALPTGMAASIALEESAVFSR